MDITSAKPLKMGFIAMEVDIFINMTLLYWFSFVTHYRLLLYVVLDIMRCVAAVHAALMNRCYLCHFNVISMKFVTLILSL